MSSVVPTSPPRSIAGWSFRTWLSRNKSSIKNLLSLALAYGTTLLPAIQKPELRAVAAAGVAVGGRLALDWIDFWLSEVELT